MLFLLLFVLPTVSRQAVTETRQMVWAMPWKVADADEEMLRRQGFAIPADLVPQAVLGPVEPPWFGSGGDAFLLDENAAWRSLTTREAKRQRPPQLDRPPSAHAAWRRGGAFARRGRAAHLRSPYLFHADADRVRVWVRGLLARWLTPRAQAIDRDSAGGAGPCAGKAPWCQGAFAQDEAAGKTAASHLSIPGSSRTVPTMARIMRASSAPAASGLR